jgi:hypothetical protein
MRTPFVIAAFAALAFAQTAAAAPISLAPVTLSAELQEDLEERLGTREGIYLQREVTDAVAEALGSAGAEIVNSAPVTIEIEIVDADPNRPTFDQLGKPPYISYFGSISIGGAELRAMLRGQDGAVLSEVTHRRYDTHLDQFSYGAATWSGARRSIRQFAAKVATAYRAQTASS